MPKVDVSPEAVAAVLADMRSGQNELDAMGLIESLASALTQAERTIAAKDKLLASRPFQPTAEQAMERIEHFCKTDELEEARDAAIVERDSALSQLAEARGKNADYDKLLRGRDKFIVNRGLWEEFVSQLPYPTSAPIPSHPEDTP